MLAQVADPSNAAEPTCAPIFVIGNSHTAAIRRGAEDAQDVVAVLNYGPAFEDRDRRSGTVVPDVAELYRPRFLFSTFGGSEHNVFGLIESAVPYDFYDPEIEGVEPGRVIVPSGMIRDTLDAAMSRKMRLLLSLRTLFDVPIAHICTPPPFRELEDVRGLPEVFREKIANGIVPPSLRRKLHRVHSDIMRRFCAANGFGFLDVPAECRDEQGFFRRQYWDRDPTHGNAAYGRLVVRQMRELTGV